MSDIEIMHGEYRIRFVEHSDEWTCYDLALTNKSLAKLLARIDKHDAYVRRVENVKAVPVGTDGMISRFDGGGCLITMIADDKSVWVAAKGKREKIEINHLAFDTPETRRTLKEYKAARDAAYEASKAAEKMLLTIPRITRSALENLKVETADADA